MPVYEYVCKQGHRFDRVKKISVSERIRENDRCECGSTAKLAPSRPSAPILVGRGFHANDYGAPTK
jgi:predicted nucleic acid-binding Zn ribbon protein